MNPPIPEDSSAPFVLRRRSLLLLGFGALVVIAVMFLGAGRASALGVSTPTAQSLTGAVTTVSNTGSSDATSVLTSAAAPTATATATLPAAAASPSPAPVVSAPPPSALAQASSPTSSSSSSAATAAAGAQVTAPVTAGVVKTTQSVSAAAQPVVIAAVTATQPVAGAAQPVVATAVTTVQPVIATAVTATQSVAAAVQPVIATAVTATQSVAAAVQPVIAAATTFALPVVTSVANVIQPVISTTGDLAATATNAASTDGEFVTGIAPMAAPATTAANDTLGIGGLDSLATADIETPLPPVTGIVSNSPQGTTSSLTTAIPPSDTKPSGGDSTVPAAAGSAPTGAGALTGSATAASSTLPSALTPIGPGSGLAAQLSPRLGSVVCGTSQSAPASAALSPLSSPTPGPVPPNRDLLLWLLGSGHGSFDSSSTSGSSAHGSLFADLSKPALWTWSSRRLAPGTVPDPDEVFFPITEQPG
jgi:hypothetical protein